jgi:hypothetical protein
VFVFFVFDLVGIFGAGFGVFALWRNAHAAPRRVLLIALVVGLVLGALSLPLTYAMSYPVITPLGGGRMVGMPFGVAFVDAQGKDHPGWVSLPSVVGNVVFWFLAPQLALFGRYRKVVRSRAVDPARVAVAEPARAQDDRD